MTLVDGRFWHFCDIARSWMNVRFREKSGRAADITGMAESDPICDIGRLEIPRRSSSLCAISFVRKHGRY
jgi:hypothetical protein